MKYHTKHLDSSDPDPVPAELDRVEAYADILPCLIEKRSAIYISVPITTGQRFITWYRDFGRLLGPSTETYRSEHQRSVILPNCEAARKYIAEIRHKYRDRNDIIIEPTSLERPEWTQDQYRHFWGIIIQRFASTVILLNGWEYSSGCSYEFLIAVRSGAKTLSSTFQPLTPRDGIEKIRRAIEEMTGQGLNVTFLKSVLQDLQGEEIRTKGEMPAPESHKVTQVVQGAQSSRFKDEVLYHLGEIGNVAQFVSFGPDSIHPQRFCRIAGFEPNYQFTSASEAITQLLQQASDGSVNVRSFRPDHPKGEPLVYGLKSVDDVLKVMKRKHSEGKFTIVNETIDVNDGGVSGVAIGAVLEFAPFDTPKCVDKSGICSLPRDLALRILTKIYGFRPALEFKPHYRVEFSIHPRKRGIRNEHTILWEIEEAGNLDIEGQPAFIWPNHFSKMLGDKAFGLLIADGFDLPVPTTTVIARKVAPFTFGRQTSTFESWIRTAPEVRSPGEYATYYGWKDPFKLMQSEEARMAGRMDSVPIASILAQESVKFLYSGALKDQEPEGVIGPGDKFMIGQSAPEHLPPEVIESVNRLRIRAIDLIGPIEFEWVYDGEITWIVQFHRQIQRNLNTTIRNTGKSVRIHVADGLERLRTYLSHTRNKSIHVILVGDVGISSHFGDLLRDAGVPWHIERPQ